MPRFLLIWTLLYLIQLGITAQRTISGKVSLAETGETLLGQSIFIKDTQVSTISDLNCYYVLELPDKASTLLVHFSNEAYEFEINSSDSLNLVIGLEEDPQVRLVFAMSRPKRELGFSTQNISNDDIVASNMPHLLDALSNKVAGLQITSTSGAAGAASMALLRGQTSLIGNNQPLIVVDGIRMNNDAIYSEDDVAGIAQSNRLMDLNPNDIQSLSILKGAAAAAQYGVNAANGAIIITTHKKMNTGNDFRIEINSSITTESISQMPQLQTQYAQGSRGEYLPPEFGLPGSWGPNIASLAYDSTIPYIYDPRGSIVDQSDQNAGMSVTPFDPIADFFQRGHTLRNQISITRGNERNHFRLSLGDMSQEGVVPNNSYNRTTLRLQTGLNLTKKLSLSINVNYTKSMLTGIQQGANTSGLMLGLLRTPPSFDNTGGLDSPVEDMAAYSFEDGSQRNYRGGRGYDNPFWTINNTRRFENVDRLFANAQLNYKWQKWLNFSLNIGTDRFNDQREQQYEIGSNNMPRGGLSMDNFNYKHIDAYFNLHGKSQFNNKLKLAYLVGGNIYSEELDRESMIGEGLFFPGNMDFSNVIENTTLNRLDRHKTLGFYGQLNLSYSNFVFLNFNARQDYISTLIVPGTFNATDIGHFYPSADLSFVFSELIPPSDILSFGQLRLAYAQVGGGVLDPYLTSSVFTLASISNGWTDGITFPFSELNGSELSDVAPNVNLKPERSTSLELGMDLHFFDNLLSLDATYYSRMSTDLLVPVELSGITGFTSALLNEGELSSKGVELIIEASPIRKRDFTWQFALNFNHNRTVINALGGEEETLPMGGLLVSHTVGYEYGQLFGTAFLRQESGSPEDDGLGIPSGAILIQDNEFSSAYGAELTDPLERVIGNPNPNFNLGLSNTLKFNNMSLYFLIDWKNGGHVFNGTEWALTFFGRTQLTADSREESSFIIEGKKLSSGLDNDIGIVRDENYWTSSAGGFGIEERFVQDASWVRLRELRLSYEIKSKWIGANQIIKSCSAYIAGHNLLLRTPYRGIDPETSLTGVGNTQGVDYFNMPGTKSYTLGLKLKF